MWYQNSSSCLELEIAWTNLTYAKMQKCPQSKVPRDQTRVNVKQASYEDFTLLWSWFIICGVVWNFQNPIPWKGLSSFWTVQWPNHGLVRSCLLVSTLHTVWSSHRPHVVASCGQLSGGRLIDNRLVVSTWISINFKLEGMKNRSKELKPQSKHHHSLFGAEKHRHIDLFPLHALQCLQPSDEARSRKREIHPKEEITSIMSMAQFLHGRFPGCGFWGKWRICHATVQNQGSKCHWRIQIHDKFNGTCDNL